MLICFLKVTDFSLSRDMSDVSDSYMSTVRGCINWLAPEMLDGNGELKLDALFKKSIDIYSLGLIFLYILTRVEGHKTFRNSCEWNPLTKPGV